MKRLTNPVVAQITEDCRAALEEVARKHGMLLEQKRCSYHYHDMPVPFQLTYPVVTEDGEQLGKAAIRFRQLAITYGMKPEWLGATFLSRGKTYKITGLNTRARKYPICADCIENGRSYKFPVRTITDLLGGE